MKALPYLLFGLALVVALAVDLWPDTKPELASVESVEFVAPVREAREWGPPRSATSMPTTTTSMPTTTTQPRLVRVIPSTTTTAPLQVASAPTSSGGSHWDRLADCESGAWDRNRQPIPGSANWADNRGGYEGGLHFAPGTWDSSKPAGYPEAAYQATREQQIVVGEIVQRNQGWGAWPVCSRKVGLR